MERSATNATGAQGFKPCLRALNLTLNPTLVIMPVTSLQKAEQHFKTSVRWSGTEHFALHFEINRHKLIKLYRSKTKSNYVPSLGVEPRGKNAWIRSPPTYPLGQRATHLFNNPACFSQIT